MRIVAAPRLLDELAEVLARDRFRSSPMEKVEAYVDPTRHHAELVEDPNEITSVTRDPDDDYFIALARATDVDALVSGDEDLTSLATLTNRRSVAAFRRHGRRVEPTSGTSSWTSSWPLTPLGTHGDMPVDLVFIRHGRSEGNEAREQSKQGDNRAYTPEFRARLNREWRLTDLGVAQARAAGRWVRRHIAPPYHRCYTSEYVRARETAAHLRLPEACWVQDILLRERSWGRADFVMPESERYELFAAELSARRQDPCYWRPPEGESLAEVCLRVERVLDRVRGRPPGGNCIVVTHEDAMWAARFVLEGLTQEQWRGLLLSDDPCDKIHNGQVLHYSRRDPETGSCSDMLEWMRSVCPWDPSGSRDEWRRIQRPNFSNEELLASVEAIERLIPGPRVEILP